MYEFAVNNNDIPTIWKLAEIVPVLGPGGPPNEGTSYRPISLLSPIAKVLEKIILPEITNNIDNIESQHGYKKQHSTTTALHKINNTIAEGFNSKPSKRTILVGLDMSKALDTVNIHKLISKLHNTNIPPIIIRFMETI